MYRKQLKEYKDKRAAYSQQQTEAQRQKDFRKTFNKKSKKISNVPLQTLPDSEEEPSVSQPRNVEPSPHESSISQFEQRGDPSRRGRGKATRERLRLENKNAEPLPDERRTFEPSRRGRGKAARERLNSQKNTSINNNDSNKSNWSVPGPSSSRVQPSNPSSRDYYGWDRSRSGSLRRNKDGWDR